MKFRDYWLRFGCFLTGYRYDIIKSCSELAAKRVKRYTSAMIIIAILWAFIGFTFSDRYLKTAWYFSLCGAMVTLLIVIQIERLIILSPKGRWVSVARLILGLTMALIGSVIIDQIIFKEDIEKEKLFADQEKIEELLQHESAELRRQIAQIDKDLQRKQEERDQLAQEVARRPMVTVYERQLTTAKNPGDSVATETATVISTQRENPKIALLNIVDVQMTELGQQRADKEKGLLTLRPAVEAKVKKNTGFLEELGVLFSLIAKSWHAKAVWGLWLAILMILEMLVLLTKWGENDTDYDARMNQQMRLHYKRLELLEKR